MTVGERIKKLREAAGLTQQALAEAAGYEDKASLSMIESGKSGVPKKKLPLIAKALGVTTHYLETGEESPEWVDEFMRGVLALPLDLRNEMVQFLHFEQYKARQREIHAARETRAEERAETRAKEGRA